MNLINFIKLEANKKQWILSTQYQDKLANVLKV